MVTVYRRSPHGERGLKLQKVLPKVMIFLSLPPRGAWIEIQLPQANIQRSIVAPPTGSVD